LGAGDVWQLWQASWQTRTRLSRTLTRLDDPEQLDGMPVGLQLVSTRHSEERALKVANVVVEAIEKSKARTQAGKL